MKSKKRVIVVITIVLVVIAVAFAVFRLGVFVYPYSMSKLTEVPEYDLLDLQYARELEILYDYMQDVYGIGDPYIIIDPYDFNPLAALMLFEIDAAYDIELTIQGDDEYSTFVYTHRVVPPRAEVPVIGLYAGRENIVTLTIDGESYEHRLTTEPLPLDFQTYILEVSNPDKMAEGITLFTACFEHSYSALVDNNADVRGYLSNKKMAHGTSMILLSNGNMLSTGDEYKQIPYNMANLFEFNWLGKIFRIYDVPNAVHHYMEELPNGDILAVSNHEHMFQSGTREDVVIIIDRETGAVKKSYDFRDIIDETREPYHHFHPDIVNAPNRDWMHTNAAIYDEMRNAVIVSSPTQSLVISIDAETSEINWILGPHYGYDEEISKYLLEPVGEDFEWHWCQHDPTLFESDDPDVINLLMFDNGQSKSFYEETAVDAKDNYSRAVIYSINLKNRTVEQLWQYGKERGSDCYATFLGSAQMLDDNVLIAFGGQLRSNGVPVDHIVQGVVGDMVTNSRVIEVTLTGEVVYEVAARDNAYTSSAETYQARRMPLFSPESFRTLLGDVRGERLGSSYVCYQSDEIPIPPIYFGKMSAEFDVIRRENGRLVIEGTLYNDGSARLLSKAFFIFRSTRGAYMYEANSGMNGRFFLSVDLSALPPGEYMIAIAGGTVEGNDALGKRTMGHFKTEYKVRGGAAH